MAPVCVENLTKVTVTLEVGTAPDRFELTPEPARADFFFGIGKEGLTPFEAALYGKKPGDQVILSLQTDRLAPTLGHLCRILPPVAETADACHLKVRIVDVRTAQDREIVKAMAQASECGCDGQCCGHHS
jgi:FKBP-type peptidyl-prolyl cis-trans isomerase 2